MPWETPALAATSLSVGRFATRPSITVYQIILKKLDKPVPVPYSLQAETFPQGGKLDGPDATFVT